MPKKILFVSTYEKPGGSTNLILDLGKTLVNYGYSISVLYPKTDPVHSRFLEEGINVVINLEIFNDVEKNLDFFKQFNLVILNGWGCYKFLEHIKKIGTPTILIVHDYNRKRLETLEIKEFHFSLPEKIVFVSNFTRQSFSDLKTRDNFLVIHNGIDIQKIQKFIQENNKNVIREKWGFSKNDIVISIVGRFLENKGQPVFIEMARMMSQSNTSNLRFLIAGFGPKKNLQEIQALITKYNLQSKLSLIIYPPNIYEIYFISDIFVSCSFRESFPLVILEAMAFNLPIIATNVGGIPEQIEDGINGILITPGDPITLSKKIEFLLNNTQVSENFIDVSKKKVREFFDIRKSAISYKNIIEELCDQ